MLSTSITGPLAIIVYLKGAENGPVRAGVQDVRPLDNKFFEYQKLALEYYMTSTF